MLDATLRRVIDPPLNAAGRVLVEVGVQANAVTLGGFALGLLAVPAIASDRPLLGLLLIGLNRLADGLDGAVARIRGPSDLGGYLDIVCDFLFYAAAVFAFVLREPADAVAGAFLILSFVGTGSSFLAYAVMAAKRGMTTEIRGSKSLYYLGGLTEGSETIAVFVLLCLLPQHFQVIAWTFGALCWLTTATRMLAAWQAFGQAGR